MRFVMIIHAVSVTASRAGHYLSSYKYRAAVRVPTPVVIFGTSFGSRGANCEPVPIPRLHRHNLQLPGSAE